MKQFSLLLVLLAQSFFLSAQGNWTWTEVASMPISTSNNAVTEAILGNKKYVYSFGGISNGLNASDIHQKVFKYDVAVDQWTQTSIIPDTLGKIASAASFVNDKIYLIGGYHVELNGTETSSEKVHIYNPNTDSFENDGAPALVPIDDHVQAVWQDSLIFVITGWSNTENVPYVQIYNPELDTWTMGTSVPNLEDYGAFGASGYIVEDTIFYFGGVKEAPLFEPTNYLRKGVIDKNDPTQIDWSLAGSNNGEPQYRAACSGHKNTVFWIGGAKKAYNFDAIEYYTNEVVEPNSRTIELNLSTKTQSDIYSEQTKAMDLRGIAKLGGGNWIIAGGINSQQQATDKSYLIHNPTLSDLQDAQTPPFFEVRNQLGGFEIVTENIGKIIVYDIQGRIIYESQKNLANLFIPMHELQKGILIFSYENNINLPLVIKKVNP